MFLIDYLICAERRVYIIYNYYCYSIHAYILALTLKSLAGDQCSLLPRVYLWKVFSCIFRCATPHFFFFFIINNCVLFLSFTNHCIKPIAQHTKHTTSVNIRTQFYLLCSLVSSVALSTYQPTELHVLAILVRVQD